MMYMLFEEINGVNTLDNAFARMQFESSSFEKLVIDDAVNLLV